MEKISLLIILFISYVTSFAQNEKLREEILAYENPEHQLVSKGRLMTIDKLLEFDKVKVKELVDYLVSVEEKGDYIVFYPAEKWLLYYWTEQYDPILKGVAEYTLTSLEEMYSKIRPPDDLFTVKLMHALREQKINIINQISISEMTEAEKDFLVLNFKYLIMDDYVEKSRRDSLNAEANRFLSLHPGSKYESYTRNYIRYELVPSNWGFAFEFFSGYGFFTDHLEENFKSNVPIGNAFDVSYKRLTLFLRNYIGFSRTLDSIPFKEEVWRKNDQVRVFLPEATLGFVALDSRSWKIIPFAGIASTSVSPTTVDINKYPEYEHVGLNFTTTYTMGLNVDLKLGRSKANPMAVNEHSYWFFRLRYAYNQPRFKHRYNRFDGDFHYITLGIGGFVRSIKRSY